MPEHLEKLDTKTRYKKPARKVGVKKNVSTGAAAALNRSLSKSSKCFLRGDTTRQLDSVVARQELGEAKTWIEVEGKMVAVDPAEFKKINRQRNEIARMAKLKRYNESLGIPIPPDAR